MPFTLYSKIIVQICNYPEKFLTILENNLPQSTLDIIQSETLPPLTPMETANAIYTIGNNVKRIGIDHFAAVVGIDSSTLSTAINLGTAMADYIFANITVSPEHTTSISDSSAPTSTDTSSVITDSSNVSTDTSSVIDSYSSPADTSSTDSSAVISTDTSSAPTTDSSSTVSTTDTSSAPSSDTSSAPPTDTSSVSTDSSSVSPTDTSSAPSSDSSSTPPTDSSSVSAS